MPEQLALIDRFRTELAILSSEGGWVFYALLLLAFSIALSLLNVWNAMNCRTAAGLTRRQWRALLRDPERDLSLMGKAREVFGDLGIRGMEQLENLLFARAERRIPFAFVLIGAAPLVGLLGTVSGMMSTFHGLAVSSASAPIETISEGISQALITTQTGLIIGVPSFVVCAMMKRTLELRMERFQRLQQRVLSH